LLSVNITLFGIIKMSSAGIAAVSQGMAVTESITSKIGIDLSNANTPGYKAFGNYLLSETSQYNGGVAATSRIKADVQGEITKTKKWIWLCNWR